MAKQLCAFCGEYTDLVRVCLTPQCQSCQIDRELHPDLPCLPECTFQHQAFPDSNCTAMTDRPQISLLQTLAKIYLDRVKALATQAETNLVAVTRAINLAGIYSLVNLTSASVKDHVLIQDQLLFLQQCCAQFSHILTVLTHSEALADLIQQLNRVDGFLNYATVAAVKPLLLPGQNFPDISDVLRVGSFKTVFGSFEPGQNRGRSHVGMVTNIVLAPGCQDDVIMNPVGSDNTTVAKIYYNLTRGEKAVVLENDATAGSPVDWLPDYYNDFQAEQQLVFSSDGVWSYDTVTKLVKHTTLADRVTTVLNQSTKRPYGCASRASANGETDRMVMVLPRSIFDDEDFDQDSEVCSAWSLTSGRWDQLWSVNVNPADTEVIFCDLVLTPSHAIIAVCYCDDGFLTVMIITVDFITGTVVSRVPVSIEMALGRPHDQTDYDHITYFGLIDYRLHILIRCSTGGTGFSYYIYTLDGHMAYKQVNLFRAQCYPDGTYSLDLIKNSKGQTKVVIYDQ